jgi:hypothetical protein
MYTDGLSEARDARGQFLDLRSLAPLLTAEPVEDALNAVLRAVRHHVPSGRLNDDLAVMLLESTAADRAAPSGQGMTRVARTMQWSDGITPVTTRDVGS